MNKTRRIVALSISLGFGLGLLLLGLALPRVAFSSDNRSGQQDGQIVGLASNALTCLAVGTDLPDKASGVVQLTWRGQIKHARLVLSIAGSEAAHHIKVNGRPATLVPAHTEGQPCSTKEYIYLDVPPEILVQGDNLIEITNDAWVGDQWTAANVRIEVFGEFAPDVSAFVSPFATGAVSVTKIITFINSYDGSSQEAMIQIPDGYDPATSRPLLIFAHGRYSVMEEGIDYFGSTTNIKGWLLASPQLHGTWKPAQSCYDNPASCDDDDQVLIDKPGAFHYASLESQYDIVGTLSYMVNHYNVRLDQIYLMGDSMGGQLAVVAAAKYPHVFAAVFDNKGPSDWEQWYYESIPSARGMMEKECRIGETPQPPPGNTFCYQRRSGIYFARDYVHVPISMTHSVSDTLVQIHHSRDLRDSINSYGPDRPASVYEDTVVGPTCPEQKYHCYAPDPMEVLNYLEPFILDNDPANANISTDESKSYYWLNLSQASGDHWSQVKVASYPISTTVTAAISDSYPLTVGLNLGSAPIMGIIQQPGMGLPASTYLVKGGGVYTLTNYMSGYLTTTLATIGQYTLTISAIDALLSANPTMVSGWQTATTMITAVVQDHLNNPIPEGTAVKFSTTAGTWPNANSAYTASSVGGQVTATLTLLSAAHSPEVVASVGNITASISVDVIHPAVDVSVKPNPTTIYEGQRVTFTYQITNTGDVTLTAVAVADDNGTPGNGGDDLTICANITMAGGTAVSYSRSATLTRAITNTVVATSQDPLGNQVTDNDWATVNIAPIEIYLPIVIRHN